MPVKHIQKFEMVEIMPVVNEINVIIQSGGSLEVGIAEFLGALSRTSIGVPEHVEAGRSTRRQHSQSVESNEQPNQANSHLF